MEELTLINRSPIPSLTFARYEVRRYHMAKLETSVYVFRVVFGMLQIFWTYVLFILQECHSNKAAVEKDCGPSI